MILTIIYLIFSFILESFMSNIFTSTFSSISVFSTIYTIIALVIVYPFFYNDKKYYIVLLVFGFLFDMIYTSTILFNMFIFFVVGIVIKLLYNYFPSNIFMTNIISIISIITYHVLSFIILSIIGYADYSIVLLGKIIIHSILMTIIYTSISYLIINFIYNKYNIKMIK